MRATHDTDAIEKQKPKANVLRYDRMSYITKDELDCTDK